jgi:hypothetical protein
MFKYLQKLHISDVRYQNIPARCFVGPFVVGPFVSRPFEVGLLWLWVGNIGLALHNLWYEELSGTHWQ